MNCYSNLKIYYVINILKKSCYILKASYAQYLYIFGYVIVLPNCF